MSNTPAKPALYSRVKSEAKRKFKIFPSAYASAWIVKEYKKRGGTYKGKKSGKTGVARWMREKWTTQDGSPCGSAKFKGVKKCRPTVRISSKTPVTWKELRKRGEAGKAIREKQRVGMGKRTKAIKRS
jgi:hypothetical protein